MNDAELARNYILGRLSEDDRARCERRFLFDSAFETLMHEQERELLDDQVNGRLPAEDSQAVLDQLAELPGRLYRLRFAEGLKRAATETENVERRPSLIERARSVFAGRRLAWAAVVAAAAAAAFIAMTLERPRVLQPKQSAAVASSSAATATATQTARPPAAATSNLAGGGVDAGHAASAMATFVLLADQQRGAGDEPTIRLSPATKIIRLQLTTEEGLDAGRYSAAVATAGGAKVFSVAHLAPRSEAGRRYIDLRLDAALLADGDYSVELAPDLASPAQPSLHYRFAVLGARSDPAR